MEYEVRPVLFDIIEVQSKSIKILISTNQVLKELTFFKDGKNLQKINSINNNLSNLSKCEGLLQILPKNKKFKRLDSLWEIVSLFLKVSKIHVKLLVNCFNDIKGLNLEETNGPIVPFLDTSFTEIIKAFQSINNMVLGISTVHANSERESLTKDIMRSKFEISGLIDQVWFVNLQSSMLFKEYVINSESANGVLLLPINFTKLNNYLNDSITCTINFENLRINFVLILSILHYSIEKFTKNLINLIERIIARVIVFSAGETDNKYTELKDTLLILENMQDLYGTAKSEVRITDDKLFYQDLIKFFETTDLFVETIEANFLISINDAINLNKEEQNTRIPNLDFFIENILVFITVLKRLKFYMIDYNNSDNINSDIKLFDNDCLHKCNLLLLKFLYHYNNSNCCYNLEGIESGYFNDFNI